MASDNWVLLHDGKTLDAHVEIHAGGLLLLPEDLLALTGWQVKDNTLCREDRCLPLSFHPQLMQGNKVDLQVLAALQGMPLVVDQVQQVVSLGESVDDQGGLLQSTVAPDFSLPDAKGNVHRLSDYRGKKILLVTWASWCGCRDDLPVWQSLYAEYRDKNFTVITIAQDSRNSDAMPFIEAANPQHPALIDNDHIVSRRYGFINVPTIIWIDESGHIARPPRVEHGSNKYAFVHKLDCEPHLRALRHWITTGETDFSVDATREQLPAPTFEEQLARTEHALAWYLYQQGYVDAAKQHWDEAIRLSPHDWTIRRGSMWLRGEDPFGEDFFKVWAEWENSGKPDYITMAAARNAEKKV
jgi:peroxiredoxin